MPAYGGAYVLKDGILKFGATDYTNQHWDCTIEPETPIQQQRTMVPDGQVSDADSATWVMKLTGFQDWESTGLAAFLWANANLTSSFTYATKKGSGKVQFTGTVTIVAPPIGGKQGEFAQIEIELPLTGAPVKGVQP